MRISVTIQRNEIVNEDEIRGTIAITNESGNVLFSAHTCELYYRHLPAGEFVGKVGNASESILGLRLIGVYDRKIVTSSLTSRIYKPRSTVCSREGGSRSSVRLPQLLLLQPSVGD